MSNGIICDHDPDRPIRNAEARAAARAAIRPTKELAQEAQQ